MIMKPNIVLQYFRAWRSGFDFYHDGFGLVVARPRSGEFGLRFEPLYSMAYEQKDIDGMLK